MKRGFILSLFVLALSFSVKGQVEIATPDLPDGDVGLPYSFSLTATNGVPPYTWHWFDSSYVPYAEASEPNSFTASGTAQGWQSSYSSSWYLSLPFAFPFGDDSYTECRVGNSGYISFSGGSIRPLYRSIDTSSGDIYVDTNPSWVTIRWEGIYRYSSFPVSFSVTLADDGTITMKYGAGNADGGQIGVLTYGGYSGYHDVRSSFSYSGSMNYADNIVFQPVLPTNSIAGVSLSTNGVVSGIPTTSYEDSITLIVEDALGDWDGEWLELMIHDDRDNDGMLDEWERGIAGDNPSDGIDTIYDVLRDDNYDGDAFSNIEEYLLDYDPVTPDGNPLDTMQEGLDLIAGLSTNDSLDRAYASLLDDCFETVVAAEPANYEARIYRAASRLINLINHEELDGVINDFGGTLSWDLQVQGEFDYTNAPLADATVDFLTTNALPAIDASFADLEVIPINWDGVVEIATNYFPVDETTYIDIGDVTAAKSMLKLVRSKILFLSAQSWNVDYEKARTPVGGPFATIAVDGSTNDWNGIPVQLYGGYHSAFESVKAAWDDSSVYLQVSVQGSNIMPVLSGHIDLTEDSYLALDISPAYGFTNTLFSETGTNTETCSFAFTNNIIEMEFPIPSGIAISNASIESMSFNDWWDSDDLETPGYTPVEVLFQNHPEPFTEIRSETAVQTAKTNLQEAIALCQQADLMIQARTDSLVHFIEYEATNELERTMFFDHLEQAELSLTSPQTILITNNYGEVVFEDSVHLGAMYEPAYLSRAMLPEFWRILPQPLDNTFPDPTFGGIFPDVTSARFEEYLLTAGGLPDCDEDGISDGWEYLYFGDPKSCIATQDEDMDGLSNYEEWYCGTDLTNAASCFRAAFAENEESPGFVISWDAVEGRRYEVQWSPNLNDGFRILATGITYPVNSYTDTLHSAGSSGFYRIIVRQPSVEDADADGLPDDWERTYLANRDEADGGADSDEDGQINLDEWIAGTDPLSALSFFAATNAVPVSPGFVVEWVSLPDRIYSVQWAPEIGAGFQTLESGMLYPRSSYTDTVHNADAAGFYKINVRRQ